MDMLPDKIWIGFDWKQAELVFLCLFSKDTRLKAALESGDVHAYVAAQVFEIIQDDVTKDQRDLAKIVSYGLIYSGFNIHTTIANIRREHPELDEDYLEEVLNKYAETFFMLFEWCNKALFDWYDEAGFVTYFMGSRKHLPVPEYLKREVDQLSNHKQGRTAINTYGQNSVGLLLKYVYSKMYQDEHVRKHTCQHIPIFDAMYMLADLHNLNDIIQRIEYYATPILEHDGFNMRMATDWKASAISWGDMKEIDIPRDWIYAPDIYAW